MTFSITNIINKYLKRLFGIQIIKVKKKPKKIQQTKFKSIYLHDPAYSYMRSTKYTMMLIDDLTQIAEGFFSSVEINKVSTPALKPIIEDFYELYKDRRLTDNTHGSGFHNAFWIFLFARVLDPELIVESGVWKAHTTWLLEQACPDASIFGFDRNLKNVEYKNLNVTLIEEDWSTFHLPEFNPDRSFVFFDCHVNNAKRIIEAKSKGFKHILFDDNPPVYKVFKYVPGIPTASMLFSNQGIDQTEISWVWNDKEITRTIDIDEAKRARKLIKIHQVFPDVGGPTGYGGFAYLTYLQI
jgi:hypothetical protein